MSDDTTKQREFVHQMANKITVISGNVRKTKRLLEERPNSDDYLGEVERLKISEETIDEVIKDLKSFRNYLHTL